MKSKIFTLTFLLLALTSFNLKAQPLNWQEDSPSDWEPITFTSDFDNKTEGETSLNITFTETGTPYFVSDTFDVTASTAFTLTMDVLDNDPAAEVNLRVVFIDASGTGTNFTSADYSVDDASFQTLTYSETAPADAVKAYVIVRMYDVAANWTSSGTFNLDNASFTQGGDNLLANPSFEIWSAPPSGPIFLTYSFAGLSPEVDGIINTDNFTVDLTVPYATDLTNLVATFTTENTIDVKVGTTSQVSGTTPNDFSSPVTYALEGTESNQDWTVTVTKDAPSAEKDILSFVFAGLDPEVYGTIDKTNHTIDLAVPTGTNLTALVPTITLSEFATVSPESGVAQDFTNPVTYTVSAQDESTQAYTVTVTETDEVVIFQEYFESVPYFIPDGWTLLENDNYTPNAGDERWTDSAWVVTTTSRPEFAGTHVAMANSYYADMPAEGRTNDWMITPAITLGSNSTLSWKAMSTTTSGNYPDDYRVIIAPASSSVDPSESYFETYGEILLTVAPESWSAAVSNPGEGISERSIALKDAGINDGYANMDVWIAFVCITGDGGGSNLAIDDIKVVEGVTTGIFNPVSQELKVSVYPNPTSGAFKLGVKSDIQSKAQIEIYDLVGRIVLSEQADVSAGQNYIDLNASEFKTGIYLVNTKINNKSNVTKLIVK